MPEYYEDRNNVLLRQPRPRAEAAVRRPQGLLVTAMIVGVVLAVWLLASTLGRGGPLTQRRVRSAIVLIEIPTGTAEPMYRTGWLCADNVVITSRDAVVDAQGRERSGLLVHVNGGEESCAVDNVEYDRAPRDGENATGELRAEYGVIILQPTQKKLRPLVVNTDPAALQVGAPVRLLGYQADGTFWPPPPVDEIRNVAKRQNSDLVVPFFRAPVGDSMVGAPLVDLRNNEVIGMVVDSQPAEDELHWALPANLLKPQLERAGGSLAR